MPILLKPLDVSGRFSGYSSVLFVACPVCPRMCLAAEKKLPYFSISGLFAPKDYFDEFIDGMCEALEREGIRTGSFKVPSFSGMMCLWSKKLRARLAKEAAGFNAVAVIGCQSAVRTVADAADPLSLNVVSLMEDQGIANFKAVTNFPFTVELHK
ncbi:MAG: hypothetical protein PHY31_08015 [Smithellaceae bacterium]|nr:hypothetical protein [Smithellaceae bacterium]